MKTFLQLLALCCCVTAQAAQQLVVPGGLANVEGNSSSSDLFVNGDAHLQQVYSASDFAFLGAATGRIDAISFRLKAGTDESFAGSWRSVVVVASTTTRSPDGLSPHFSDNLGSDITGVFAGALFIVAPNSDLEPRPFDVRIPFATPFFYNPSAGNLSIDIVTLGSRTLTLDSQLVPGDSISRVWANPDSLNGTVDSMGLVTRFDITPIPEPASAALWSMGMVVLYFVTYLRKHHCTK
jgi:hypothetical protein